MRKHLSLPRLWSHRWLGDASGPWFQENVRDDGCETAEANGANAAADSSRQYKIIHDVNDGLKQWKARWARAFSMSPQELADRLRQQASARLDLLRYKAGFPFEPQVAAHTSSAEKEPQFFFEANEIPRLCALLREHFSAETEEIIARAERVCDHRFDLLGYRDLDYGREIDWHCDQVHGKVAPRKCWYQIGYLDFAEVGDSKITWELNRHQHFVTLAKAYRLTGDSRFVDEMLRQWRQWQADNPYPIGINWASSLEVAFRSLSWIWSYHLLEGARGLPGFRDEWLRGLALHGRHMERYLSTYFSPNTHLLGEGAGLFFLGVLCPELAGAARWKSLGW